VHASDKIKLTVSDEIQIDETEAEQSVYIKHEGTSSDGFKVPTFKMKSSKCTYTVRVSETYGSFT
jgi:hypothetical protein